MTRRWVTTAPTTVRGALSELGVPASALTSTVAEGRVFVGRTRATSVAQPLEIGVEVQLHARRSDVELPDPFILHDELGVLIVHKPAHVSTVPDLESSVGSLVAIAAEATGRAAHLLHPTSRLDREVSGVVTFAVDDAANEALAAARVEGRYARRYVAVARGTLADHADGLDRWTWSIDRARDPRLRAARPTDDPTAKKAATRVLIVQSARSGRAGHPDTYLLALAPETGRTHQLRVHAAAAGAPLIGDVAYGGSRRLIAPTGAVTTFDRVALHCARVTLVADLHGRRTTIDAHAPIPDALRSLVRRLFSVDEATADGLFEEAIRCEL